MSISIRILVVGCSDYPHYCNRIWKFIDNINRIDFCDITDYSTRLHDSIDTIVFRCNTSRGVTEYVFVRGPPYVSSDYLFNSYDYVLVMYDDTTVKTSLEYWMSVIPRVHNTYRHVIIYKLDGFGNRSSVAHIPNSTERYMCTIVQNRYRVLDVISENTHISRWILIIILKDYMCDRSVRLYTRRYASPPCE